MLFVSANEGLLNFIKPWNQKEFWKPIKIRIRYRIITVFDLITWELWDLRPMGLKLDGLEPKTDGYETEWSIFSPLTVYFVQWLFSFSQKCQNRVILYKWSRPLKRPSNCQEFDQLNSRPLDFVQTVQFAEVVQFGDRSFLPLQTWLFLGKGKPPTFVFHCNECRIGPKTVLFHMTIYFHSFGPYTLVLALSELRNSSKNWERVWN